MMLRKKTNRGFTLIELLLVVVIIGILLAVIVPRAWRANVDSKYGLVRQSAAELASFASLWAEEMMEAQDLNTPAGDRGPSLTAYYVSLATQDDGTTTSVWLGDQGNNNWAGGAAIGIPDRHIGGLDAPLPEASVDGFIPPERLQRNPFTGTSVFMDNPTGDTVIPGALAAGHASDDGYVYFALVFQGTGSTSTSLLLAGLSGLSPYMIALADFLSPAAAYAGDDSKNGGSEPGQGPGAAGGGTFHAGMGTDLPGLRNGVFMARLPAQ